MTLKWSDFPCAPKVGTTVVLKKDVQNGLSSLSHDGFSMLILRDDTGIRAFVNACPHQFLPLDRRGNPLSADGKNIVCTNHDAVFDGQSGIGKSGFGLNCALSEIPLIDDFGVLKISNSESP